MTFLRAGPTTTTTSLEFISRGPIFHFWGSPRWSTKCPFYTVEHRETTKILHLMCHQMPFWCGIRCKTFLKVMVVVVFGPSLIFLCWRLTCSDPSMSECSRTCMAFTSLPWPWCTMWCAQFRTCDGPLCSWGNTYQGECTNSLTHTQSAHTPPKSLFKCFAELFIMSWPGPLFVVLMSSRRESSTRS